jgi:hypothetical protein
MTHDGSIMVDGSLSADVYFTLHCPGSFISFVDSSLHARLCIYDLYHIGRAQHEVAIKKSNTKLPFSRKTLKTVVSGALRRTYRGTRHAANHLATLLNIQPVTARTLIFGTRAPGSWNLVQLMAVNRDLRTDIDRLIDQIEAWHVAQARRAHDAGKINLRQWSEHAHLGVRDIAPACVGHGQNWHTDHVAFRSHIALVDVVQTVGRIDRLPERADACPARPGENPAANMPEAGAV